MISCILLSAGQSQRFGSPKALVSLGERPLIQEIQQRLLNTQVTEIIIVLGAHAEHIQPALLEHKKVSVVYNKDHKFGQTSSFKEGLKHVGDGIKGVMLHPIDYPLIAENTYAVLMTHFVENCPRVQIPTYGERKGHPPIFDISLVDEFLSLDNDVGLNTIAQQHSDETVLFPVDDAGVLKSFNTPEELEGLQLS